VCGGGRYDSMIGGFLEDGKVYPSVGISFGLETIFDALSLSENKEMQASVVDVYIVPMKDDFIKPALKIAKTLRALDVNTDISYVNKKFKKGMEYANTYKIPWVIILGEDEIKSEKVMLRNMKTGDQKLFDVKEVAEEILKFK
ncbi:histidine--tRNA ligase, partial [Candidatus Falkowbacteria bacterium]|nr:histidine--tRNA ligase [Candidatus Falkowbacteria bacterium]